MTILLLPIPPKPDYFGPDGAPPGIRIMTGAYNTLSDGSSWTPTRPVIKPRLGIVHTNAASVEASVDSSINYGRAGRNNTKPHYLVAEPYSAKVLATNLRGIANSTGSEIEEMYNEIDCSFWSYAIETADTGTNADPTISDFLKPGQSKFGPVNTPHAELVARIFAYESIVWNHPLVVPPQWNNAGIVTHTWPYPYPYYTIRPGKTCPGPKKIATFQSEIIQRANLIRAAWLNQEEDMITLPTPKRVYDSRQTGGEFGPGETRTIDVGPGVSEVFVNITCVGRFNGHLSVNDPSGSTSVLNYSTDDQVECNGVPALATGGKITVTNHAGRAYVIIDVLQQK